MEIKNLKKVAHKLGVLGLANKLNDRRNKTQLKKQYYQFLKTNRFPKPPTILFDPTNRCNLRCKMCFIDHNELSKRKEMSIEEFKLMIDKLPFLKNLIFIGGEIFIRKDIFEMFDYLEEKKINFIISTNGTLLNDSKIERLKGYKALNLISLSLDGTKEIHNTIRGEGNFEKTTTAIRKLRKKGIFVMVISVITNYNLDYLADIVKVCKGLDVNILKFEYERKYTIQEMQESSEILKLENNSYNFPIVSVEDGSNDYSLLDFKTKLTNALQMGRNLNQLVVTMPLDLLKGIETYYKRTAEGKHFCKQLIQPRIDAQGNFIFCFAIKSNLGNILEKGFNEIWYGQAMKDIRKNILSVDYLPMCRDCEKLIKL